MMLTAAFLSIPFSKKGLSIALTQFFICMFFQFGMQHLASYHAVEMMYPLIVHLPILIMAIFVFKCSPIRSAVALLAAYLFTIPRNLLGEIAALISTAPYAKELTKIIVTVPLFLLFLKFACPIMQKILLKSKRELFLFLVPALIYYVIIYATSVFTSAIYHGSFFTVSLLATLLCFCTFAYVFLDYKQLEKNALLNEEHQIMQLKIDETALRLDEIRDSQQKAKILRHDMRHYLQIIYDYAEENNTVEIKKYIQSIQSNIDKTMVADYCKNESINLVLSSYHDKAQKQGAILTVSAVLPEILPNELDICIILANGLENALNACTAIIAPKSIPAPCPQISVECHLIDSKTVIRITNPYIDDIEFCDDIPVSHRINHGTGTKSILSLVTSHGGVADFSANDGIFIMRAVL